MPEYLTPAEYPAVRAAIDITLSVRNLPDSIIGLPQYRGEAERWVAANDPDSASYTPGTEAYERTTVATIYACAALLAPSLPILTAEAYGQAYRYTRKETDVEALVASLWVRARSSLAIQEEQAAADKAPVRFIFTLARGRRGL